MSKFYIVSMSMLVYMHMYDFECRIMIGNTKQAIKNGDEVGKTGNTEHDVNSKGGRM